MAWPDQGEAALYLSGFGWLGSTAHEESVPIASVTKIMTALVILRAHPLQMGESGPVITVTAADLALYRSELAQGDSVVRVDSGETLTELQALEGLLLPSGDNLAVLLADWQAGSESAFVEEMDQLAGSLHLEQTHFTDSSGLDPGSVSSARDLVILATVAMQNPVFASIVAMPTVSLPIAGTVRNYNPILGQEGVIGIKTGWTEAALGCLVFAAKETIGGHQVQLVGAVLGQPGGPVTGLAAAGRAASLLLTASDAELHQTTLPGSGSVVGAVTSEWAEPLAVRVTHSVSLIGVAGARVHLHLQWQRLRAPLRRGEEVASLTVTTPGGFHFHENEVVNRKLAAPDWWWRLTRSL
jgi:D-alanyl-D-alanine carboxypeptidase (penicillin-binding protein 5/6)